MPNKAILLIPTIVIFFVITSCSIFETREPESPIGTGGVFILPTTPSIVVENFINSFSSKNPDNYYNCFSSEKYIFHPTAEVAARYPSLFANWHSKNERQYMVANCAALEKESNPYLQFETSVFDFISTDSAVLITNYTIFCNVIDNSIPDNYSGRMILTIIPDKSGLWSISSFQDFQSEFDTLKNTWSQLKAYFSN